MKIYISGPMSGIAAFHAAAKLVRRAGHHAVNPAENGSDPAKTWADYMRLDISQLLECEAILRLPGHENSRGARLECHIGKELGLLIADSLTELEALRPIPMEKL